MTKKILFCFLLISFLSSAQGVTINPINATSYTTTQLINNVLMNSGCGTISNVTSSNLVGIGYFNANGTNFPFQDGIVLKSGVATSTAGQYTGVNISSVGSGTTDIDLQSINTANGNSGNITDATFIKFNVTPQSTILSFNFLYASNEYGQYQCGFSDAFAFILTNLNTGISQNLAVIPNTTTPISVTTVRNSLFNATCASANSSFFGQYNVTNVANSRINMRGQTIPMSATATVIPNTPYSLKLVIGDYQDNMFDSAVFIEGGSFISGFQSQCQDNIQMIAFLDTNGNGMKDSGEQNFNKGTFSHQVNNTGTTVQNTSSTGRVLLFPQNITNTFDLSFQINALYAPYYSTSTTFNDISIAANSGSNFYYFPVTGTPYTDVSVGLIPISQPRPGFVYTNRISYTNNGTLPASGVLTFTKDPNVSFNNISQSGTVPNTNGFSYIYNNLLPNETRIITVKMNVPTIPTVSLGTTLNNSVAITTTQTDGILTNNSGILNQIIVGSYDPNDKTEHKGAKILHSSFSNNDYLEYTIRFQNEGTAAAEIVKIKDILSPLLNPQSIIMLDASHDYVMKRTANELVWEFNPIILPPKIQNEEASNGYVHFKIKPTAGFEIGTEIFNTASIFFDFNPAIITNTFETEFVAALNNQDFDSKQFTIFPNPAKTIITVKNSNNEIIENIKIIDIYGKTLIETLVKNNTSSIDVSLLSKGIYVVKITTSSRHIITKKISIH